MVVKSYKDLIVWQKSVALADAVYLFTKEFPATEKFGLVSQMRRAVVSISSNIAEGYERRSSRELLHFLSIAFGSAAELEVQLLFCNHQSYGNSEQQQTINLLLMEVMKLLNAFRSSIRRRIASRP